MRQCCDCGHWYGMSEFVGECRRFPQRVEVPPDYGCGEFRSIDEPTDEQITDLLKRLKLNATATAIRGGQTDEQ